VKNDNPFGGDLWGLATVLAEAAGGRDADLREVQSTLRRLDVSSNAARGCSSYCHAAERLSHPTATALLSGR